MKEYRSKFNQYFKRFDIKEADILQKFHHSYRVMGYVKEIGKSLDLEEHDIWLCEMIGLFHDIGRFEQWTRYQTYIDRNSVDHGDLSCEVIEEEKILDGINNIDKNIILNAIKYHNKYEIESIIDERVLLFCKIIRDADKLDILFEQGNTISKIEKSLPKKILEEIYSKKLCSNEYVNTDVDIVLRHMGFIFDLNFSHSFKTLEKKDWFKNKFNLLENYVEEKSDLQELEEFVNKYVEEMIMC